MSEEKGITMSTCAKVETNPCMVERVHILVKKMRAVNDCINGIGGAVFGECRTEMEGGAKTPSTMNELLDVLEDEVDRGLSVARSIKGRI